MYATERHQLIVDRARARGRVEVHALATELEVTPETIRRDLSALERLAPGPAHSRRRDPGRADHLRTRLADRETRHVEQKHRIARAALAQLPEEGAVLIDAGSTTAELARVIPDDRVLTVVTNGLTVAMILAERPNITLHQVGGRVRGRTLAAVDDWAVRALHDVIVDVAFIGTNGASLAGRADHARPGRGGGQARHDRLGPAKGAAGRPFQVRNGSLRTLWLARRTRHSCHRRPSRRRAGD